MKEIDTLLRFFSSSHVAWIKAIAAPLHRCFGIDVFWHSIIYPSGQFSHFSNTPEGTSSYFENRYYLNNPFLCHPHNYSDGYCIVSELDQGPFLEAQNRHNCKFGINHVLYLCKQQKERCHLFGFATSHKNLPMLNVYVNNLPLLKRFIAHYLEDLNQSATKLERFAINLPQLVGSAFFQTSVDPFMAKNKKQQNRFLQLLGYEPLDPKQLSALSRREKECLDLFLQGKTAEQTAAILQLSRRTVEFYFENIKNKLGCFTKDEILKRHCPL